MMNPPAHLPRNTAFGTKKKKSRPKKGTGRRKNQPLSSIYITPVPTIPPVIIPVIYQKPQLNQSIEFLILNIKSSALLIF